MIRAFLDRLKTLLRTHEPLIAHLLLMPIAPLLCWGPFTHPYVNYKALDRVKGKKRYKDASGNVHTVNRDLVRVAEDHEETFIFAGNSTDAIATHHLANDTFIYDYLHNWIPHELDGLPTDPPRRPLVGNALVSEWFHNRCRWSDREGAVAMGWLGHQTADWYPHYARVDTQCTRLEPEEGPADEENVFWGYCNAHPIWGADFHKPVLIRNTINEHALIELLQDFVVRNGEGVEWLQSSRCEMFEQIGGTNLLTEVSSRFWPRYMRIPAEHVDPLRRDFDLVIDGMALLIEAMGLVRPDLPDVLAAAPQRVLRSQRFVDRSIDKVATEVFCTEIGPPSKIDLSIDGRPLKDVDIGPPGTRPGTALFAIAHKVGLSAGLDVAAAMIGDDGLRVTLPGLGCLAPTFHVGKKLVAALAGAAEARFGRPGGKQKQLPAFLTSLLLHPGASFEKAVKDSVRHGKSAVTFGRNYRRRDLDEEYVMRFLRSGEGQVRLYPAGSKSSGGLRSGKRLLPGTLLFRINGFAASQMPEQIEINTQFEHEDSEGVLVVACRLKQDPAELVQSIGMGAYHVFIDIQDASGVWAEHLDLVVTVKGREPGT